MPASEPDRQLVVFSLQGEEYALPVASVREIIRYTQPTATGAATRLVRGMINFRGRVLPIVELSARLGHEMEVKPDTRIIVLEVSKGMLGLVVDRVLGLLELAPDQVEPVPVPLAKNALGDHIAAVEERLIMLIDPERALAGALVTEQTRRRRRTGAAPSAADNPPPAGDQPGP